MIARKTSRGWQPAWKMSFYLMGLPYAALSLALLTLGVMIAVSDAAWRNPFQAVIIVLPLIGAVQAAFLFAPDDEQALEVLLAAPRPARWLIAERAAALFAMHVSLGLAGSLIVALLPGGEDLTHHLIRWLPPFVALSGLSAAVSFMFRRSSYGVLVAILLYGSTLLGGDALVMHALEARLGLAAPTLLSHAWVLHPFLQAHALGALDYLINRLVLCLLGAGLFAAMMRWIHDTERTLGKS
ncbi:hypothetical protein FBR02_15675 [Anaerolineae bacterium CFX9]|nr:hypothetical protein [Anaerolineae bacterium CFX9]